ncbi:MAG: hydrolase Nlp/P60 [Marinilabiliales bacterium]|nr:MAG: hydrolase Nlp/P60 [Marinilabiliales bacterium]
MEYGVSLLPVIPLRTNPSEKSEMITQLLFGEYVKIVDKEGQWWMVEFPDDSYQGWTTGKMLTPVTEEQAVRAAETDARVTANLILPVAPRDTEDISLIPAGSILNEYKPASNSFTAGSKLFSCRQQPLFYDPESLRFKVDEVAESFINIPYLWGGKNPFGIDCSGLTQVIMRIFGIKIPRDARKQVDRGNPVSFITEAEPGDLAFFDNEEGEIIHTGIIVSNQQIIHASGCVRKDRIDHQGIYNSAVKRYTHRLRVIKNLASYRH